MGEEENDGKRMEKIWMKSGKGEHCSFFQSFLTHWGLRCYCWPLGVSLGPLLLETSP